MSACDDYPNLAARFRFTAVADQETIDALAEIDHLRSDVAVLLSKLAKAETALRRLATAAEALAVALEPVTPLVHKDVNSVDHVHSRIVALTRWRELTDTPATTTRAEGGETT